jgi:hypothetical protein
LDVVEGTPTLDGPYLDPALRCGGFVENFFLVLPYQVPPLGVGLVQFGNPLIGLLHVGACPVLPGFLHDLGIVPAFHFSFRDCLISFLKINFKKTGLLD